MGIAAVMKFAAAGGEQGVAAKQHVIAIKADVAFAMAGGVEHLECEVAEGDGVAFGEHVVQVRYAVVGGAVDGDPVVGQHVTDAADVVPTAVGDQDRTEAELVAFEIVDHGLGEAGVDDGDMALAKFDGPNVVVLENGDGMNRVHRLFFMAAFGHNADKRLRARQGMADADNSPINFQEFKVL